MSGATWTRCSGRPLTRGRRFASRPGAGGSATAACQGQIRGRVAQLIQQRGPFDRFCTAVYLKLSHHNDLMGLEAELTGYEHLLALDTPEVAGATVRGAPGSGRPVSQGLARFPQIGNQ